MSFKIDFKEKDGKINLIFDGHLDEFVELPEIEVSGHGEIVLNLEKILSVNSLGIRTWLDWIKNFEGKARFQFINCPKCIVMQMNMVEGFIPKNSEVLSFYVPYYCESCDEEKSVLVDVRKNILMGSDVKLNIDKSKICKADCEIEMDVNESKYFKFLKDIEAHKKAS